MTKQQNKEELQLDTKALKEAAMVYRAVNNKLRQKILQVIDRNERVFVGEVYKKLRIEQSVASLHLAILRNQNIVSRTGREIHFLHGQS